MAEGRRALRAAVVGVSATATSGVRDHATLLAPALASEDVTCTTHWLQRSQTSLRRSRKEVGGWADELAQTLREQRPDVALLHYSAFAYAHRGVPLFAAPVLAALRRAKVPSVVFLHELAYAWRAGDARADLWAATQRIALMDVMRTSRAAIVTTDQRVRWLGSRRWLARRPVAMAPVFSNLPDPGPETKPARQRVVGLFGYAYQGAAATVVLDALDLLALGGHPVQLRLLGAPGPDSDAGREWRAGAHARGVEGELSFSGVLDPQQLSDALASCDVLLCAASPGPTSRKGTLAASLASGRPVIAIDGPLRWPEPVEHGALELVEPTPRALADAIQGLLVDQPRQEMLGARGRHFAQDRMSVQRTARIVAETFQAALDGAKPPAASVAGDQVRL